MNAVAWICLTVFFLGFLGTVCFLGWCEMKKYEDDDEN